MANTDIYDLSINNEFKEIIQVAMLKAATQISGEDPTGKTDIEALKRHNLATNAIRSTESWTIIFADTCSAQPGLYSVVSVGGTGLPTDPLVYAGGDTLDNAIEFTVNSVWDDVAGVSYADKNP
jgi:hypothetical protein